MEGNPGRIRLGIMVGFLVGGWCVEVMVMVMVMVGVQGLLVLSFLLPYYVSGWFGGFLVGLYELWYYGYGGVVIWLDAGRWEMVVAVANI